jgi:hypothetical protein
MREIGLEGACVVREVEPLPSGAGGDEGEHHGDESVARGGPRDRKSLFGEPAGERVSGGARRGGPFLARNAKALDLTLARILSAILDQESSAPQFPALSSHDAPVILSCDA